jgi:hypothetical protein
MPVALCNGMLFFRKVSPLKRFGGSTAPGEYGVSIIFSDNWVVGNRSVTWGDWAWAAFPRLGGPITKTLECGYLTGG